jgi:hypothetical protein
MAIVHFKVTVKDSRLLELPEEAQELGLKPGDQFEISFAPDNSETNFPPNEKGLAIMREIAERHKNRPHTDGSDTLRLLREARAGAMYGYDPTE